MKVRDGVPHCANHTSKAAKEHGRGQMNGLVGCVPVTLGSLASTQDSQNSIWEMEIHDVLDGEIAILQNECAPEGIGVMDGMASKMQDLGFCIL
jgi:hypothetical protein